MIKKSVKRKIKKAIVKVGSKQKLANELGISLRQVYYYASGEKKAPITIDYVLTWILAGPEDEYRREILTK